MAIGGVWKGSCFAESVRGAWHRASACALARESRRRERHALACIVHRRLGLLHRFVRVRLAHAYEGRPRVRDVRPLVRADRLDRPVRRRVARHRRVEAVARVHHAFLHVARRGVVDRPGGVPPVGACGVARVFVLLMRLAWRRACACDLARESRRRERRALVRIVHRGLGRLRRVVRLRLDHCHHVSTRTTTSVVDGMHNVWTTHVSREQRRWQAHCRAHSRQM